MNNILHFLKPERKRFLSIHQFNIKANLIRNNVFDYLDLETFHKSMLIDVYLRYEKLINLKNLVIHSYKVVIQTLNDLQYSLNDLQIQGLATRLFFTQPNLNFMKYIIQNNLHYKLNLKFLRQELELYLMEFKKILDTLTMLNQNLTPKTLQKAWNEYLDVFKSITPLLI
jgi:hypothetical protein